jgi:LPPG:FO 2-phospho-L-lactate transferase
LITILAGGTGSVKLVRGLAKVEKDITVVSNVGDNIWLYGLYICPDVDTVVYGLAGVLDEERGWGIRGDTFSFLDQLEKYGEKPWFGLGDRDVATHVIRTAMMRRGSSLSQVTAFFAEKFGISARVVPATDDEVPTMIATRRGEMHLQEFWVKNMGRPEVTGVRYDGAEKARASTAATDAIRRSERVIIAPGNPVSSIGPMLALQGLRSELAKARDRVIAVSPVIGGRPLSGPAAKYMKAIGRASTAAGVAKLYRDVAGTLVISESDRRLSRSIEKTGLRARHADITMKDRQDEVRLARHLARMEAG